MLSRDFTDEKRMFRKSCHRFLAADIVKSIITRGMFSDRHHPFNVRSL